MPLFKREEKKKRVIPLRNIGYYRSKALRERAKDPEWLRRYADKEFGLGSPDPKEDAENKIKLSIANQAVTMIEKDPDLRVAVVENYLKNMFGNKDDGNSLQSADPMETVLRYSRNIKELKEFFRDEKETSGGVGALAAALAALVPHLPALLGVLQQQGTAQPARRKLASPNGAAEIAQAAPTMQLQSRAEEEFPVSVPTEERDEYKDVISVKQDGNSMPRPKVEIPPDKKKISNPLNPDFLLSLCSLEPDEAASFFTGAVEEFMKNCEPLDHIKVQAFMGVVKHQTWQDLVKFLSPYKNDPAWGEVLDFLTDNPEWSQRFFVRVRAFWDDISIRSYENESDSEESEVEQEE